MAGDDDRDAARQGRRASFQEGARTRLLVAIQQRDDARATLDETDAALREAVRDAEAAGMTLVELAELTGWHRNTVRRIVTGD